MEDNIYFKQKLLFDPNQNNAKVHVYGIGSIGSHVAVALAKIGVKDITVYDYDVVEEDNVPAQFYWSQHGQGFDKIVALRQVIRAMTKLEIEGVDGLITEEFQPDTSFDSVHILCFDNIEARQLIVNKLKGFPVHLIDGRIGGFNYEKYYVRMDENVTAYQKTLEGVFSELECGEKCLWPVNSLIASKIVADVVKVCSDRIPNFMVKGNLMGDLCIVKEGM